MLCTAFVSAVLAIKIVAAHLYKTIDSYLDKHDAQIMDLILSLIHISEPTRPY